MVRQGRGAARRTLRGRRLDDEDPADDLYPDESDLDDPDWDDPDWDDQDWDDEWADDDRPASAATSLYRSGWSLAGPQPADARPVGRRGGRRRRRTFWSELRLVLVIFPLVIITLVVLAVTTDLDKPTDKLGNGSVARIGAGGENPPTGLPTASAGPSNGTAGQASAAPAAPSPIGPGLVWSDEFDGPAGAPPDPATWTPQTGYGWGIDEMQCYTSDPRNLAMDGQGNLVITMLREPSCEGAQFSSARIETYGKKSMHYGYLEVRAVLPTRTGAFPAVWMMGTDMAEVGWPAAGEIDVVEAASPSPTLAFTNLHGIDANGQHWEATWGNGGIHDAGVNLADGFHTYGLEWLPDRLRFYFDGQLTRTITRDQVPVWLWDKPNYLIMNAAILPTAAQAAPGDYPQRMVIDYVRVYSAKP